MNLDDFRMHRRRQSRVCYHRHLKSEIQTEQEGTQESIAFHCIAEDSTEAFDKAREFCAVKRFRERGIEVTEMRLTEIIRVIEGCRVTLTPIEGSLYTKKGGTKHGRE